MSKGQKYGAPRNMEHKNNDLLEQLANHYTTVSVQQNNY